MELKLLLTRCLKESRNDISICNVLKTHSISSKISVSSTNLVKNPMPGNLLGDLYEFGASLGIVKEWNFCCWLLGCNLVQVL